MGQSPVGMAHPPGQSALGIVRHHGRMAGIIGKIGELLRIGLQVEQQSRHGGEMDIFPVFILDHHQVRIIHGQAKFGFDPQPRFSFGLQRRQGGGEIGGEIGGKSARA